jgi:HSP20 family molecular chaperone IbpA
MQSPLRVHQVPPSPLRSPILQRHLIDNVDIAYPSQFLRARPPIKQNLIAQDGHFRAAVDVFDFNINEVQVKLQGHTINVSASHEEKDDAHGKIMRNFSKKYVLPMNMDMDKVESKISKGVLYLKVPPKDQDRLESRIINIKIE